MRKSPNPPPAANPATMLVPYSWPEWRGVAEAGRSAAQATIHHSQDKQ